MTFLDNGPLVLHENPFALPRTAVNPRDTAAFASPITRMLLSSDGLTTTLLESATGLRTHILGAEHERVPADAAPRGAAELLHVPLDDAILVRRSTTATDDGRALALNQVVARTDIPGAERCLTDAAAPLGLALHAAGTGFRRTVLHIGRRAWHPDPGRPPAVFKTYLLWHRDIPAVAISELFSPEFIPADLANPGAVR
ncbi:hypothetical protein ABZ805_20445 [Saccharopolyspora sp. NPDC047091]|uniref:hypothetical protein n=1 Tax=Saccharopolyspora sp. NPDC047091 TaxID=3155924 RepID=UPI00340F4A34